MEFEEMARKIIEQECEDYFLGIVDLSLVEDVAIDKYRPLIFEYPRAISIGITLPNLITEELMNENIEFYKETNCQLNAITVHLSRLLQEKGYMALPVPKPERVNDGTFISLHKLAANLANLGWIENNLLVTPEVGIGVNWGTVLTDAPIGIK